MASSSPERPEASGVKHDPGRGRWHAHITYEVRERFAEGNWVEVPRSPKGNLEAGMDIGVNNLMAVYVENGRTILVNGRPLKATSHYWIDKISGYQSTLNRYGLKTFRRLRLMYRSWRFEVKSYIVSKVRSIMETLYEMGVSRLKVGYPRNIAQENGDFNIVHVWTYGYLLRKLREVGEEYEIEVVPSNEEYSSSKYPLHRDTTCGLRVKRGLFKCIEAKKVFNADLVGAYNILVDGKPITLSPPSRGIGVTGRRPGPRLNRGSLGM
ncbi:MAG: transposase [Thermoprotei archaeon]